MSDPFSTNSLAAGPTYPAAGVTSPYQAEDLASFAGLAAGLPVITRDAYVRKDRTGQELPGDAEAFARYDQNGDGVLSQAEWLLGRLADRDFSQEATPAAIAPIPLPDDPTLLMQDVPGNWAAPSNPNNMPFTTVSPIGLYFTQPQANQALPAALPRVGDAQALPAALPQAGDPQALPAALPQAGDPQALPAALPQAGDPQTLPQPIAANPVGEASPLGVFPAANNGSSSGATAAPIGPYITAPGALPPAIAQPQAPLQPLPLPIQRPLGTPSALGPINVAPATFTLGNQPGANGSTAAPLGTFPLAVAPAAQLPMPIPQATMPTLAAPGLPAPLPLPPPPALPPPLAPPPPPLAMRLPPLPTLPLAPPPFAPLQAQLFAPPPFAPQPAQMFGPQPYQPSPLDQIAQSINAIDHIIERGQRHDRR